MPDTTHTNVSTHPQSLASGQVVAPGETCTVTNSPHDRALIADGALAPTETRTDYPAMKHDQLAGLTEGAELDVKGTGKDGGVTNADLEKALAANDKKAT